MERTGAMNAYLLAYVVILAVLVVFLLNVLGVFHVLSMEGAEDPSAFALPLALFGVLMLLVIAAGLVWRHAPRRPWFWVVGAIPGLLFFLPDIPIIIQAMTSPASVIEVLLAVVVTAGVLALLVTTVLSFFDARRLRAQRA